MPSNTKNNPSNEGSGGCAISTVLHLNTSIHDTHVSFAVLDIKMSYDYKYMALACDNHCHFIIENSTCGTSGNSGGSSSDSVVRPAKIIRRLYGHVADSYSRPIVAWSCNNQYIYCNTQNDTKLCIYSIASGKLINDDDTTTDQKHHWDNNNNHDSPAHHRTNTTDTTSTNTAVQSTSHVRPIKHLCSHPYQNVLITTSFDHNTIVWTAQEPKEEVL
jgi:hypothetical protein